MAWLWCSLAVLLGGLFSLVVSGFVDYEETQRLEPQDVSCSVYMTSMEVSLPGCIPRKIRTRACRGSCHSWAFPKWVPEDSHSLVTRGIHMVHNCKCCKPHSLRSQIVTFACPGRGGNVRRVLKVPVDCSCRPCSDIPHHSVKTFDY